MRLLARLPLPLALVAGLSIGLSVSPAQAGSAPGQTSGAAAAQASGQAAPTRRIPSTTTAAPASTTPSLGEAFGASTADQIALVEHLRSRGAVFYGAFWCQHCFKQKVLFGQQAGNRLPYVECAKDQAGAQACSAAGVMAYPTWVMGTERRVGLQTLQELAAWSQYKGSASFTSAKPGL